MSLRLLSILTFLTFNLATGQAQGLKITPASGLSPDEVERIIADAEEHEREDTVRVQHVAQRNKLESLLLTTEKTFAEFGKLLPDDRREAVRNAIDAAKRAVEDDELIPIRESITELKVASNLLTEVILSGSM